MEVFMKNQFNAYETLRDIDIRFEADNGVLFLKLTGVSKGKHKQIQITFSKMDFTEIKNLKIFMGEADKFIKGGIL